MSNKIQFERVTKSFPLRRSAASQLDDAREVLALENLTLDLKRGELLCLVGPSGCGKSTLVDLVAGLSQPSRGRVLLDGRPITGPALDRAVVFQQYALFPWRTALGNVEFGLESKNLPKKERTAVAREYLEWVGLTGFENHYPHELSGGMKQRVAIARSLAYEPDVLVMDEPFAALDAQTRETLQSELLRIWERSRKTILFITHGIDEAVYLGQRVAIMTSRPGRIKQVVDVALRREQGDEDVRSSESFRAIRHEVWESLRVEVTKAQQQERRHLGLARAEGTRPREISP